MGWINNYRLVSISSKLKSLDEWLRNRLRYCIRPDSYREEKPERKRKNLIKLGKTMHTHGVELGRAGC